MLKDKMYGNNPIATDDLSETFRK